MKKQVGFTLIEMIGVLAIIAILVGAVAPRIFEAIQESNANNASTLHKTVQTAVTKFYGDMKVLEGVTGFATTNAIPLPFDPTIVDDGGANSFSGLLLHSKTSTQTAQSWAKFRGPYLDKFVVTDAPVGDGMGIDVETTSGFEGAVAANNDENFDLNFNGTGDIANGNQVITLRYDDVSTNLFEKIDAIIDNGLGTNPRLAGKVKYDGKFIRIFVAQD